MLDSLVDRITAHAARIRLGAEVSVGVLFALTAAYYAISFTADPFVAIVLLPLGAGIALYRVAPIVGLLTSVVPLIVITITGWSGGTPSGALWIPIYVAIFGAVAYGTEQTRWVGRSFALALSVAFIAGGIGYVGYGLGAFGLLALLMPAVAWICGELLRAVRARRTLTTQVAAVSTQRDAAVTRADLEAERTRVARDVHDIVAHSLTVVIAQADGARYATAADSPAASDAFETIARSARDALTDVRALLTELRHTQVAGPQPGVTDLDALISSMRESGLHVDLREFGTRGRLTETRGLALYRIVQESLTNALRHGDGAATLELEWGESAVDLVVTNLARDPQTATATAAAGPHDARRGHGIDGMRERTALSGGELSVHEGATFRIRARLPLEPPEERVSVDGTPTTAPASATVPLESDLAPNETATETETAPIGARA